MSLTTNYLQPELAIEPDRGLDWAIIQTVAYADVFDFPINKEEIHRYLIGISASLSEVATALLHPLQQNRYLEQHGPYFTLPGRGNLVSVRKHRAKISQQMWPHAIRFGKSISRLPFVRMIAITGALAVWNVEKDADYDYLIVTQPGRLWLCRALVNLLVRKTSLEKRIICPNYFLSEKELIFPGQNLYAAHELTQMIPVAGFAIYRQMRASNTWTNLYLPNAKSAPQLTGMKPRSKDVSTTRMSTLAENLLSSQLGAELDKWEMKRKIRKFNSRKTSYSEADFGPDWCKGHFDNHGIWVMNAFEHRLMQLTNFQT